jgi:predicted N-acyltransferase
MRINKTIVVMAALGCLLISTLWAQGQQAQDKQLQAYVDMMRKNLRTERQSIVDQAMELDAGGKAKFWTVYEKYQGELKTVWDQRLANIKKYGDNYEMMTDAVADGLAIKAMDIDSQRAAIRKKYYTQMKTALGAKAAVRFLQIEVVLDHLLDLQIGAEVPLIK